MNKLLIYLVYLFVILPLGWMADFLEYLRHLIRGRA